MAATSTRPAIIKRKAPLYPLNTPVEVLFVQCKYHKRGTIVRENTSCGEVYYFVPAAGVNYKKRPIFPSVAIETLVNGEPWDCFERFSDE